MHIPEFNVSKCFVFVFGRTSVCVLVKLDFY